MKRFMFTTVVMVLCGILVAGGHAKAGDDIKKEIRGAVIGMPEHQAASGILGNCRSQISFAKQAIKDRRHIQIEQAVPFYFEKVRERLKKAGYTPVLQSVEKEWVRGTAEFMWEDKTRTENDFFVSCLQGNEKTAPYWYRVYVSVRGIPSQVTAKVNLPQ